MKTIWPRYRGEMILTLAALLWGVGFVAQRHAMGIMGPYLFSGLRFLLATVSLLVFLLVVQPGLREPGKRAPGPITASVLRRGTILGLLLAAGNALQQTGLQSTTAGKAGFITGLYIAFIPIFLRLFWKVKMSSSATVGVAVALAGLYLLSVTPESAPLGPINCAINSGDLAVLGCALIYSFHVIASSRFTTQTEPVVLCAIQLGIASFLSFLAALALEPLHLEMLRSGLLDVIYAGVFAASIGFTLQLIGQKHCPPTVAGVIMSLESVFALLAGRLLLGEEMTSAQLLGCVLALSGMVISQFGNFPNQVITLSANIDPAHS